MKKLVFLLVFSLSLILSVGSFAQNRLLNATNNGLTFTQCGGYVVDDGGLTGNHGHNYDYSITICATRSPGSPTATQRLSLSFQEFNLGEGDTMTAYDGRYKIPSAQFSPENVFDFTGNFLEGRTLLSTMGDTSGCITLRLVTDNMLNSSGFKAKIECIARCQYPVASLDTFFIKFDTAGNMSVRPVKEGVDSIYNDAGDSVVSLVRFKSVDFCVGDSIVLVPKAQFPENNNLYHQSDSTCAYTWNFGDGISDSTAFSHSSYTITDSSTNPPTTYLVNNSVGHKWSTVTGYDLSLYVLDTNQKYVNGTGCYSRNTIDTRIRISRNPIKTVAPLPTMCSGDLFKLKVGYGGNQTVSTDSMDFKKQFKEQFDSTVFIPDGPLCVPGGGMQCYSSPVFFDQFRPGSQIQSANDIISVCVNMEHSYIGDIYIWLVCPDGKRVELKTKAGGSKYLGIPAGGNAHGNFDSTNPCTTPPNLAGEGWWYCFSTLRTVPASPLLNDCQQVAGVSLTNPAWNCQTCDSTNRADTIASVTNRYYKPQGGFGSLVGCPMNGQWEIEVCDDWGIDNGFVFSWYMELGMTSSANWEYQVAIDTVAWDGPFMQTFTSTSAEIHPVDTSGAFKYDIHIVDEFGCVWDTATNLKVVRTPVVDLGPDRAVCESMNAVLDAGNPGATSYIWEPNGETTQQITAQTAANSNSEITYIAQVTNYNGEIYCYGIDSVNLIVYPAALASFDMNKNPLEGCEPLEFTLHSTSNNAATYLWKVGPFTSTEPNPSFSFPYGTYDVSLKVTSANNCTDSIYETGIINVYKSPIADFGWNPTNPSVTMPTINLINLTSPHDPTNQYIWKVQASKMNDFRENVFGYEPSYTWTPVTGYNVEGNYNITLDAYSVNLSPSGIIYDCHDTISKVVTIINDNLIFPNALTPNGDGINDIFYIKNLIEGQAFPDNELAIYNRLGRRVFFKQDIRNKEDFWDPALTNSPTGTYFYRFIGRGPIRDVELIGAVEVLK